MNSRQRYIETLTFGTPDKVPLWPGWGRRPTLEAWHQQGLPKEMGLGDYHAYLWELIGLDGEVPVEPVDPGIDFEMLPRFEEKVLEHREGSYVVQDWKGNICEISDKHDVTDIRTAIDFVTRNWLKCPVENCDDWAQMKERYNPDSPGRFSEDFDERVTELEKRDCMAKFVVNGPFWQLRDWLGFEELCIFLYEEPDWVAEMAQFHTNYMSQMLKRVFERFVPDEIVISEDMAYKGNAMISPAMTRDLCGPAWKKWTKQAKDAGVKIVTVDSDGFIDELIPLWIEAGVDCCYPLEVAAHCDIVADRQRFGQSMAYYDGIDKRCIAKGGQSIIDELKRIEPVMTDGGFIPSCDHAVPHDVSWPNFVEYTRLLAKMTGWL